MPPDAAHLLTRTTHRARGTPEVPLPGGLSLPRARVHEFCGTARRTLALIAARGTQGPIFWIRPRWAAEHLHCSALAPWIDPGRLVFFAARRAEDILWTVEEALRSGEVPLVVGDLPGAPSLTNVRRMHLAAETGASEGSTAPLGLILTPGRGAAPGVETRWRLTPDHGAEARTAWRLDRLRARTLPPAGWTLTPDRKGGFLVETAAAPDIAVNH